MILRAFQLQPPREQETFFLLSSHGEVPANTFKYKALLSVEIFLLYGMAVVAIYSSHTGSLVQPDSGIQGSSPVSVSRTSSASTDVSVPQTLENPADVSASASIPVFIPEPESQTENLEAVIGQQIYYKFLFVSHLLIDSMWSMSTWQTLCKGTQLARNRIVVVLTARDDKIGLHQLDVADQKALPLWQILLRNNLGN
ncbi:hypothetical protein V6N11_006957 [Hibiscus sabdariffa]|uniref:Uncharacterized protein n=1 Tax=Hibiscus sabdariffa TaxID=183260 RepID=A0ABR2RS83_9ROSI